MTTKAKCYGMGRHIIRRWDAVNGRLVVDYIRVGRWSSTCRRFESPILMPSPESCKGKMSRRGDDCTFGNSFVLDLAALIRKGHLTTTLDY
jgi:hypothetical protein